MKGRVGQESDKPLPAVPEHPTWRPGGEAVSFRASIVRNRHKWAVKVLCLSADKERAFIRFETNSAAETTGTQTCWVSVDELQEG